MTSQKTDTASAKADTASQKRGGTNQQFGAASRERQRSPKECQRSPKERGLIAPRQLGFLFAAFLPLNKVVFLPALFAAEAGHALLYPLILSLLFDFCTLVLVMTLAVRGEGFPAVLYSAFGRVGGKIILALLAATLLVQATLPLGEERLLIQLGLYETAPSLFYVAPLFVFGYFLLQKSPTVVGRAADLAVFATVAALGATLLFALPSAKMQRLLPLLPQKWGGVWRAVQNGALSFGEGLYPLFLLGKFPAEKRENRKIYSGFLMGAGLTVCFFALFYAVFGALAPDVPFALTDIAKHNLSGLNIGRVDYFSVFILLGTACVGLLLPAYFAARCLQLLFGKEDFSASGVDTAHFAERGSCPACENKKGGKQGACSKKLRKGFFFCHRRALISAGVTLALFCFTAFSESRFATLSGALRSWFFPAAMIMRLLLPLLLLAHSALRGAEKTDAEKERDAEKTDAEKEEETCAEKRKDQNPCGKKFQNKNKENAVR